MKRHFNCVASAATLAVATMADAAAGTALPPPLPIVTAAACVFNVDATSFDGKVWHTKSASLSASSTGLEVRLNFGARVLPDPALAAASNRQPSMQAGGLRIEVTRASGADFRFERAGDAAPIYMREAPVLKVGNTWFVGDRIDVDRQEGLVVATVSADFMEEFQRTRHFEIWWKGARRLTLAAMPAKLPPAEFSAQCLAMPPMIRDLIKNGGSMRKLALSAAPRVMTFIGRPMEG